jgi:hypothetical protein
MDTPSGYQGMGGAERIGPYSSRSQCEAVNSQYFNGAGSCSCTSTTPRYEEPKGAGSVYQRPGIDYGEIERRREEERRRRRAEEEAKRHAEEAAEKFNKEKMDVLKSLKGVGHERLELKSGTATLGLQNPNPTGQLELKGISPREIDLRSISREWRQHYCGTWIASYTFSAAKKGNVKEVCFLGRQAIKAFKGETIELQCPEVKPPPEIYDGVAIDSNSILDKFYTKILNLTEKEALRIEKAEKEIQTATAKKDKAKEDVEEKKKDVKRLEEEIKEMNTPSLGEEKNNASQEGDTGDQEELEKKRRALREALAALRKARQVMADVDKTIVFAEKEIAGAQARLSQYKDTFNKVKENPALAPRLVGRVGE